METLKSGTDTLFILLGAIMVLAMHSGFAFLELGTVRRKTRWKRAGQDPGRLRDSTIAYFSHRLLACVRRAVLRRRRGVAQKNGSSHQFSS